MKRLTSGVAVTLALMLFGAPSALAQTGGGTSVSTTPAVPADGSTTPADPSQDTAPAAPAAPAAAVSQTKTVTLTRSQTKRVQKRVRVKQDGAVGARTRSAIKRYQGRRKLTKTGRPNLETIKAMKMPFAKQVEAKLAGTGPSGASTTVATGDLSAVIEAARAVIGTPYSSGGNDASGFDCSGLTVYAFKRAGITLPRTSFDQFTEGTAVEKSAIQPGDLVFFSTAGAGASHVGIATSPTTAISATTKGVAEHRIDDDYWGGAYVGARRVTASSDTGTSAAR